MTAETLILATWAAATVFVVWMALSTTWLRLRRRERQQDEEYPELPPPPWVEAR